MATAQEITNTLNALAKTQRTRTMLGKLSEKYDPFHVLISTIHPPREVWNATKGSHWTFLFSLGAVYFFYMLFLDTWGLIHILRNFFGHPLQWSKILKARARSYLVSIVNYGAGQAALAYLVAREEKKTLAQSAALMIFISLTDLYWILTFAFVGCFFHSPVIEGYRPQGAMTLLWAIGTAFFLILVGFRRFLRPAFLAPFRLISIPHFFSAMISRLPTAISPVLVFYFIPPAFGVTLSIGRILSCMPLVLLVGALPITPGGLGAVQIAFVELMKDGVVTSPNASPESVLLSMSLVWTFINYFWKALFGTWSLRNNLLKE